MPDNATTETRTPIQFIADEQRGPLMVIRHDGTLILRDDVKASLRAIVREMVREEVQAQTKGAMASQLRQFVAGG